jgi:hypothetical protein
VLLEVGVITSTRSSGKESVRFADAWFALERSFADLSKGQYGA